MTDHPIPGVAVVPAADDIETVPLDAIPEVGYVHLDVVDRTLIVIETGVQLLLRVRQAVGEDLQHPLLGQGVESPRCH